MIPQFSKSFLIPLLILTLTAILIAASGGVVKGTVTSSETNEPFSGATVVLRNADTEVVEYSSLTGSDGEFSIEGVDPGSYSVEITAIDCDTLKSQITIAEGDTLETGGSLSAFAPEPEEEEE